MVLPVSRSLVHLAGGRRQRGCLSPLAEFFFSLSNRQFVRLSVRLSVCLFSRSFVGFSCAETISFDNKSAKFARPFARQLARLPSGLRVPRRPLPSLAQRR